MKPYRTYSADVSYSPEDRLIVGKIANVDALILFSAESLDDLEVEFHLAVDEYIQECEQNGVEAERPFKGTFNVRIGSDAHRKAARTAAKWKVSLNEFVRIAVEQAIDRYEMRDFVPIKSEAIRPTQSDYPWAAGSLPTLQARPEYRKN